MKILSQRDPQWSKEKLGESNATIGMYGCLICSLSMLSDWCGKYQDPKWMARNLHFNSSGLLLWPSINTTPDMPMNFVYRYYKQDKEKILEILKSKDRMCVLNIQYGKHWVVLVGYSRIGGYKVADPWSGNIRNIGSGEGLVGFAELIKK